MSSPSLELRMVGTEKKILQIIAIKERTYYELWKKDKVAASNKTVQIALKKLQEKGLIKPKKKTKGTEKKPYVLTSRGLLATLSQKDSPSWRNIDQIAKQQERLLPLIFGKWSIFRENVDDKPLIRTLKWVFSMAWQKRLEKAKWVIQDLFFYIINMTVPEEKISWLKVIHKDSELRQRFLQEEWSFSGYAHMVVESFDLIRQLKPDWDKGLEKLRRINRMPLSKELEESVKKEMEEQLEAKD